MTVKLKKAILLEIDGVLADSAGYLDDPPNDWCSEILIDMHSLHVLYVTARPEKYRNQTLSWLMQNDLPTNVPHATLLMRPLLFEGCEKMDLDRLSSVEIKEEIYEREIKDTFEVLFVLERGAAARMYRELGLTVLEVK